MCIRDRDSMERANGVVEVCADNDADILSLLLDNPLSSGPSVTRNMMPDVNRDGARTLVFFAMSFAITAAAFRILNLFKLCSCLPTALQPDTVGAVANALGAICAFGGISLARNSSVMLYYAIRVSGPLDAAAVTNMTSETTDYTYGYALEAANAAGIAMALCAIDSIWAAKPDAPPPRAAATPGAAPSEDSD